jgi:transposase
MVKPILDDELWALIKPHLPARKPRGFRFLGRKPIGNRQALTGVLFVRITGIPWQMLPKELAYRSTMTRAEIVNIRHPTHVARRTGSRQRRDPLAVPA